MQHSCNGGWETPFSISFRPGLIEPPQFPPSLSLLWGLLLRCVGQEELFAALFNVGIRARLSPATLSPALPDEGAAASMEATLFNSRTGVPTRYKGVTDMRDTLRSNCLLRSNPFSSLDCME